MLAFHLHHDDTIILVHTSVGETHVIAVKITDTLGQNSEFRIFCHNEALATRIIRALESIPETTDAVSDE